MFLAQVPYFHRVPLETSLSNDIFLNFLLFFQVAACYTKELSDYAQKLIDVLEKFSSVMDPDIRMVRLEMNMGPSNSSLSYKLIYVCSNFQTMCRALILMRNKNLLEPTALLSLFFKLLNCQDKNLRKFLETHLITDIKNQNNKHKNVKLNTVSVVVRERCRKSFHFRYFCANVVCISFRFCKILCLR